MLWWCHDDRCLGGREVGTYLASEADVSGGPRCFSANLAVLFSDFPSALFLGIARGDPIEIIFLAPLSLSVGENVQYGAAVFFRSGLCM